ncbi:hypothetical protein ADL01_23555 [Streptomyces sp. NRRL WC-3618]|nr:hypothetical protein ADL01_23555 [Streptomyces sp. NRRL WC-3618]
MFSLWRFVPGTGWVLQPVPVSPGCVVGPDVPQRFGFRRTLHWVRRLLRTAGAFHTGAAVLTAGGLVWMWLAGHEVEVLGAVLAGIAVGAFLSAYEDLKRAVRRRRARRLFGSGGERAW